MFVRDATEADRRWISEVLTGRWGASVVVVTGRVRDAARLPALIAEADGERAGLLTYEVGPAGLEVVSLDALTPGRGAGTALLREARRVATEHGHDRVWLITTNDNLDALRFYQRRGMRLARVHPGAADRGRLLKPSIPVVGAYNIGLHDELELESTAVPVRIRPGALADAAAVLDLLDGAGRWLAGLGRTGQWGTEPQSANPRRRAAITEWAVTGGLFLADLAGRSVGALALGPAPPPIPPVDEPEVYVRLLVTSREHRGLSLGGTLLDHARALAVQRGVALLRVDCYRGDDRALVRWYERQGFTATETFTVGDWPGQILEQRLV